MRFIKKEFNIDFMGQARFWIVISSILILISFASFVFKGFNYGIDFLGGTAINLKFKPSVSADADGIRNALSTVGMENAVVQTYGLKEENEYIVKIAKTGTELETYGKPMTDALGNEFKGENKVLDLRFAADRVYLAMEKETDTERIKRAVGGLNIKGLDLKGVSVYGQTANREYLVEFKGITQIVSGALLKVFKEGDFDIIKVDTVGRKVGKELRRDAVLASFIALFFILVYIWLRFEIEFAPGGILCLFHDAVITVGVFSLFGLEIDTTFIAAILTLIGYSINDTIVIYDRIRENLVVSKELSFSAIINKSINQTLSRTILTSFTVILVTVAILVAGGPILFNMSLALTIGAVIGSYSTIFIASPLTLYVHNAFFVKKNPTFK